MLELAEARERILSSIQTLPAENLPLRRAHGRILAEKILAPIDLPRFDNSAVDGYAARSRDLLSAARAKPVSLRLTGKIAAGELSTGKIRSGECVRIFTGSPLPEGADSVAMQEDTEAFPQDAARVLFFDSTKPWENIRFRAEDVKAGSPLAEAGARMGAGHLALLGAIGMKTVRVSRRPRLGLLATGSELREGGAKLQRGQIYESNRVALAALAAKTGALPKIFPLVRDTLAATKAALKKALTECDAIVTTGGVSVGEFDFVKTAFTELGGELAFWKISIKPGKPFVFGQRREKFFFGLPGNPVSAFVTFVLLVAPALAKMQGARNFFWPQHPGILAEPLENNGPRPHFVRVTVDERGRVHSAGAQASHILSALARADGLVEIPPETILAEGSEVSVLRFD